MFLGHGIKQGAAWRTYMYCIKKSFPGDIFSSQKELLWNMIATTNTYHKISFVLSIFLYFNSVF